MCAGVPCTCFTTPANEPSSTMQNSDWLHLDRELLYEVFSCLTIQGRLVCERICKQWYSVLSCHIQRDMWGDMWTFVNHQHKALQRHSLQDSYHLVICMSQSTHTSDLFSWASRRFPSVYQLNLGDNQHPVDLLNDSHAEGLVYSLLARMKAEEADTDLSLWAKGPPFTLSTRIFDLLPSFCTALTLGPGLTSVDVGDLIRLTRLTELEVRFHNSMRSLNLMPVDQLTRLQHLDTLGLIFPPRLPASMQSFASLTSLTIAPRTQAAIDLRHCKQLSYLCLKPSRIQDVPVLLPVGVESCLRTLEIFASCLFENLAEAQGLRRVVMSAKSGVIQSIRWPRTMLSLEAIAMDKWNGYGTCDSWHDGNDPLHLGLVCLPNEWQHYTSLKRLSLYYHGISLPNWLPQLQHLTRLELLYANMQTFPLCLSQLQDLQHLDLEGVQSFTFRITHNVVRLANLQHLTYLSFGSQPSNNSHQVKALTRLSLELLSRDEPLQRMDCQHGECEEVWTFVKI